MPLQQQLPTCSDNFDFTSTVEGYGLSLELVADHEGCTRWHEHIPVYLDVANANDQVTSFTGNDGRVTLNTKLPTTLVHDPNDITEIAILRSPSSRTTTT